jgi:hypothetical protein
MANFKLKIKRGASTPAVGTLDLGELGFNTTDKILYVGNGSGNAATPFLPASGVVTRFSGGTTGLTPNTLTAGEITLSGTLVTTHGGTGLTGYTKGDLLFSSATNVLSKLGIGSLNQILTVGGDGTPVWANQQALVTLTNGSGDYVSGLSLSGQAITETKASFQALTASTGITFSGSYDTKTARTVSLTEITPSTSEATQGALWYHGITPEAGKFDGSTTAPSGTVRLNYGGYLYGTQLFDGGTRVATTVSETGSGNAITSVSKSGSTITFTKGSTFLTAHPTITTTTDTTSTASPGYAGTFTAIDSVTRDANGHVTTLNTKTVTMPSAQTLPTSFTISATSDVLNATGGSNSTTYSAFTTSTNGRFYRNATNPTNTTAGDTLKFGGIFHATQLFESGTRVLTAESDTLATVTGRGATTGTAVSFTNNTASTSTTTGAVVITGGVGVGGRLNVGGETIIGGALTVTGNLTINGTTTTINSTQKTIDDPLLTLGGDTWATTVDSLDRGIEYRSTGSVITAGSFVVGQRYTIVTAGTTSFTAIGAANNSVGTTFTATGAGSGTGTAIQSYLGFFGFDKSTGYFTFIPNGSNTSEVLSGTTGTIDVSGLINNSGTLTISTGSNGRIDLAPNGTGKVRLVGFGGAGFVKTNADGDLIRDTTAYFSDWNAAGNYAFKTIAVSGQTSVVADSNEDTLTLAAGTGITIATAESTDTITITNSDRGSSQSIFKNFAVSGQSTVVADSNDDTLTLVAGTNVQITTNASSDSITINAAHGLGAHSDVTITSPDANDLLLYNGTAWVNVEELDCGSYAV